ncbi:hypothetical protein M4D79_02470 [Mycolicibacterium novocastrense]|nr:hypothetical protein M4D79_02470 [Mycolicibacterium novocastrense]
MLQGMKVWTRHAAGVRELAQQDRDLINESASAAATTLQRATPGVGPVLSDWVADAPPPRAPVARQGCGRGASVRAG